MTPDLTPDCSKCAALCCMALPFDEGDQFAADKPGGVACTHLRAGHTCSIHSDLAARGYLGCVAYDCRGAGQRVVQEVFDGRSWQQDAALIAPMSDSFFVMRQIHELHDLLGTARRLPLTGEQRASCDALSAALEPPEGWSRDTLADLDLDAARRDVTGFLKGLRGLVARNADATAGQKKTPA